MHIEPVINVRFKLFREQYGLEKIQDGLAFERFVNYHILYAHNPEPFFGNSDFLNFCSVGGSNDLSIDGIAVKLNGIFIRSIDDVVDIVGKSNKAIVEFIFIQSKYKEKFEMGEYNNFISGVRDFLSEKHLQPMNEQIKKLLNIKDYILSEDVMILWEKNPSIRLYFVTMGKKQALPHIDGLNKQFVQDINTMNTYDNNINIRLIDSVSFKEICDDNLCSFTEVIEVIESMPLTSVENVENSCMALCYANEIDKILRTADGVIRKSLFNDNVRDFQGDTTVNEEIEKTISDEPQKFVLLNNGITIVCDEYKPNNRKITLINPQIVNGCQTSHMIFFAKEKGLDISKVPVSIKIISTQDNYITGQIVRGTNKQNIVYDEAFETIRDYHKDLEEVFPAISNKKVILYYERRSKQYQANPMIKQVQKVSFRLLIQGFIAMFLNEPEKAYRHESKLIREYKNKVFLDSHSKLLYYTVGIANYYLEQEFIENPQYARDFKILKYHVLMIIKELFGKPPMINKEKDIDQYCMIIIEKMNIDSKRIIKKAIDILNTSKDVWTNKMGKSVHGIKDVPEFTKLLLENSSPNEKNPEEIFETGIVRRIIKDRNGYFCGFIKRVSDDVFFHSRFNPSLDFSTLENKTVLYRLQDYSHKNFGLTKVAVEVKLAD